MRRLEAKINALMQFATAQTLEDQREARQKILRLQAHDGYAIDHADPDAILHQILLDLGAPINLIGYRYILMAVKLLMENPEQSITNNLYPSVANAFGSTASRVERAIRHVIEIIWDRGGSGCAKSLLWQHSVRPQRQAHKLALSCTDSKCGATTDEFYGVMTMAQKNATPTKAQQKVIKRRITGNVKVLDK